MPELAQDRVHHDAAIGIVFCAKDGQRPREVSLALRPSLTRGSHIGADRPARETECRSRCLSCWSPEIAAHRLCKALDKRKTKPGAAVKFRNFCARLARTDETTASTRPALMPIPLSAKREDQPHALACACSASALNRHIPGMGEFHRVVGRDFPAPHAGASASPDTMAGRSSAILTSVVRALLSARAASAAPTASASARGEKGSLRRTRPRAFAFAASTINVVRADKMVGAAFDRARPFAFARAQIGRGQQFGQAPRSRSVACGYRARCRRGQLRRQPPARFCVHEMMTHAFAWQIWPWSSVWTLSPLPGPTMARMRGSIETGQSADVGWRSAAHAKLTQAGSLR